jgi:hypothetical protein
VRAQVFGRVARRQPVGAAKRRGSAARRGAAESGPLRGSGGGKLVFCWVLCEIFVNWSQAASAAYAYSAQNAKHCARANKHTFERCIGGRSTTTCGRGIRLYTLSCGTPPSSMVWLLCMYAAFKHGGTAVLLLPVLLLSNIVWQVSIFYVLGGLILMIYIFYISSIFLLNQEHTNLSMQKGKRSQT